MLRIGIVGHRFFTGAEAADFVHQQCHFLLKKFQETDSDLIALSAIAEGADSIFAEVALSLKIPLEIVRPFEQYEDDFTTLRSKNLYLKLCIFAAKETLLAYKSRTTDAYFHAMQWIVTGTDILIAVWDGEEGSGKGGTADAVQYVTSLNKDWIHLNVSDLSVTSHVKKITLHI